jgi:hypothetical protein
VTCRACLALTLHQPPLPCTANLAVIIGVDFRGCASSLSTATPVLDPPTISATTTGATIGRIQDAPPPEKFGLFFLVFVPKVVWSSYEQVLAIFRSGASFLVWRTPLFLGGLDLCWLWEKDTARRGERNNVLRVLSNYRQLPPGASLAASLSAYYRRRYTHIAAPLHPLLAGWFSKDATFHYHHNQDPGAGTDF